jgi:hypothetical protein
MDSKILMNFVGSWALMGIEVSDFEPHQLNTSSFVQYGAMCRLTQFSLISIPSNELVELFVGINYDRQPSSEKRLLPYAFISFKWDSAQRPKIFRETFERLAEPIRAAGYLMDISATGCHICVNSDESIIREWSGVSNSLEQLVAGVAKVITENMQFELPLAL